MEYGEGLQFLLSYFYFYIFNLFCSDYIVAYEFYTNSLMFGSLGNQEFSLLKVWNVLWEEVQLLNRKDGAYDDFDAFI